MTYFARLTAMAALFLAIPASGRGDITSIAVSGPGGTGHGAISPSSAYVGNLSLDFTTVNPITITVQVNSPTTDRGPNAEYELDSFGDTTPRSTITNNTPVKWTSFLVEAGFYMNGANSGGPELVSNHVGVSGSTEWVWSNGGSPVGIDQDFPYAVLFKAAEPGTYSFVMLPNAPDPISVPEPSGLVIVAMAIAVGSAAALLGRWPARRYRPCAMTHPGASGELAA